MRKIYSAAFACARQFWPVYLVFAAMLEVADWFSTGSSSLGVEFFAYTIFAYLLHRHFLFGDPVAAFGKVASARPSSQGRFILISLPMMLVPMGIATLLLIGPLQSAMTSDKGDLAARLLILFLPVYLLMLSVFGTMLPAAASAEPFGLGLTLRRARRSFWPIFGGLLIGPGLFGIASVLAMTALSSWLGIAVDARDAAGQFSPVGAVLAVGMRLIALTNTTLAVVVLCGAYRRVAPPPVPADATRMA